MWEPQHMLLVPTRLEPTRTKGNRPSQDANHSKKAILSMPASPLASPNLGVVPQTAISAHASHAFNPGA